MALAAAAPILSGIGEFAVSTLGAMGASAAFNKLKDWVSNIDFSRLKDSITGGAKQFADAASLYTQKASRQAQAGFERFSNWAQNKVGAGDYYEGAGPDYTTEVLEGSYPDLGDILNAQSPYTATTDRYVPPPGMSVDKGKRVLNIPKEFGPDRPSNVTEFGYSTGETAVGQRIPPVGNASAPVPPVENPWYRRFFTQQPASNLEHGILIPAQDKVTQTTKGVGQFKGRGGNILHQSSAAPLTSEGAQARAIAKSYRQSLGAPETQIKGETFVQTGAPPRGSIERERARYRQFERDVAANRWTEMHPERAARKLPPTMPQRLAAVMASPYANAMDYRRRMAVDYPQPSSQFGFSTGDSYVPRQAPFPGPIGSPKVVVEKTDWRAEQIAKEQALLAEATRGAAALSKKKAAAAKIPKLEAKLAAQEARTEKTLKEIEAKERAAAGRQALKADLEKRKKSGKPPLKR